MDIANGLINLPIRINMASVPLIKVGIQMEALFLQIHAVVLNTGTHLTSKCSRPSIAVPIRMLSLFQVEMFVKIVGDIFEGG